MLLVPVKKRYCIFNFLIYKNFFFCEIEILCLFLQVKESPFVERLLKKGFEVLYLTEAVDEYAIGALPEFEGKKFQNVAKEGVEIDGDRYEYLFN